MIQRLSKALCVCVCARAHVCCKVVEIAIWKCFGIFSVKVKISKCKMNFYTTNIKFVISLARFFVLFLRE